MSFTRAAQRLATAQQPLSKSVAELEAELGVRLFDRTTRHVALTEAGRVAYTELIELLERHERMRARIKRAARGETGRLSVAAGNYAMNSVLPALLRSFHERYPEVTISLDGDQATAQLEALSRRDVDIAFPLLPPPREDVRFERMHEGGFVVVMAENVPLPQAAVPTPLAAFRDFGFIGVPRARAPGLDDLRAKLYAEAGFTPRFVQFSNDPTMMLALAAGGIGVLLAPAANHPVELPATRLVPIATKLRASLAMAVRKGEPMSAVVANFWELAIEVRDKMRWVPRQSRRRA